MSRTPSPFPAPAFPTRNNSSATANLDPATFLWSAGACALAFLVVALRALVWLRRLLRYRSNNKRFYISEYVAPPSAAPLVLGLILLLSLGLRGLWSFFKYEQQAELHRGGHGLPKDVSDPWLLLLDRAPLLLLLSAFSRMSLFWMKVFLPSQRKVACIVLYANLCLYIATGVQFVGSFFSDSFIEPHSGIYIAVLLAISLWCMILSMLFSVFGWRLRKSLLSQQSLLSPSRSNTITSAGVRSALNRILAATIVCTVMFGVRGSIFLVRTLSWNVEHVVGAANVWIYPLVVYTLPDVVGSISIMFCMDVEGDTRDRSSSRAGERGRLSDGARRGGHSRGGYSRGGSGGMLDGANASFGGGSSVLSGDSILSSEGMRSGGEGLFAALSDEISPDQSPMMGRQHLQQPPAFR